MPNAAILTDVKCITKQQYSSDLWILSLKAKRNCIVDKLLKFIKIALKYAVRLILDNFSIVGFHLFGRIPVFFLTSLFILMVF
jgi:hypothetical protein